MKRLPVLAAAITSFMMSGAANAADQLFPTLTIFDCGTIDIADIASFSDSGDYDGRELRVIVPCYLISHPGGTLLWDGGISQATVDDPENGTGAFLSTIDRTLSAQLGEIGIGPADIDYVALSHMHWDHTGNANMFAGTATWLVREAQYDYAFREGAAEMGFDASTYGELADGPLEIIRGDYDLFGDGSVILMTAPGHTPGHQVLFVELAEYGPVVLSGDLYAMRESREKRLVPTYNFDRDMTLKSMERIEAFIAARGAKMIIQHSFEDYAALPHSPDLLK